MNAPTAILVFARSAAAENSTKRFCSDPEQSSVILELLNQRTLRLARATGCPVFHLTEREQRGTDFGQRISNAAADVFAKGYERLIILGNDCPTLTPQLLRRAEKILLSGHSAIGPDLRGGAYLIGLHRADFSPQTFAALPWQTIRLRTALRHYLANASLLSLQRDLNGRSDLLRLSGLVSGNHYLTLLFQLLAVPTPGPQGTKRLLVSAFSTGSYRDRGPPVRWSLNA